MEDEETNSLKRAGKSALAAVATGVGLVVPGGALVGRLIQHVQEVREERQAAKSRGFCLRLMHGLSSEEEQQTFMGGLGALPEFPELVDAMGADVELEKADVYAMAVLLIVHGDIPVDSRRDLVHTVQQLRMEDFAFLAAVCSQSREVIERPTNDTITGYDARHKGIIERLHLNGCLREGGLGVSFPTLFGRQINGWFHSLLPADAIKNARHPSRPLW
ncbi:MAG: hypothetical protein QM778_35220 [Myxococcales bacterium]